MAQHAVTAPILPGKLEAWKDFLRELGGPRCREFEASRRDVGLRERVYLQETPQGAFAIVTWEGAEPQKAMQIFGRQTGPFADWFRAKIKDLHGIDLASVTDPPSKLLLDVGSARPSVPAEQRV